VLALSSGLLKKSRRVREKRVQSTEAEKATNGSHFFSAALILRGVDDT